MRILSPRTVLFVLALLASALALALPAHAQPGTMVRVHTSQGPMDLRLLDADAPLTVANFLAYVRGNDWTDMFFHRSARTTGGQPFVIQGGGFAWPSSGTCCESVESRGQVRNEFSAARSNVRGTVAMAKQASGPNTATNQWFVNLGDNSANLDSQNGGFTVFARVTGPGMVVADRIAALQVVNAGSPFNELPVTGWSPGNPVLRHNLVTVGAVTELPPLSAQTDSDRIFTYLEAAYPQYLSPAEGVSGTSGGYTYRYYADTQAYVASKDGKVWYLVPSLGPDIGELGPIADWLAVAEQAGY